MKKRRILLWSEHASKHRGEQGFLRHSWIEEYTQGLLYKRRNTASADYSLLIIIRLLSSRIVHAGRFYNYSPCSLYKILMKRSPKNQIVTRYSQRTDFQVSLFPSPLQKKGCTCSPRLATHLILKDLPQR